MKSKTPYNKYLNSFAKKLRKELTYAEVKLWIQLRNYSMLGYDFHRQIPLLNFIADFYSEELRLVIETDGITHDDEIGAKKDNIKDFELNKAGITVMRFSDKEIINDMGNVVRTIENYILDYEERYGVDEKVLKRRSKMMKK
jgi:very-short-patch-repair endonuclease